MGIDGGVSNAPSGKSALSRRLIVPDTLFRGLPEREDGAWAMGPFLPQKTANTTAEQVAAGSTAGHRKLCVSLFFRG